MGVVAKNFPGRTGDDASSLRVALAGAGMISEYHLRAWAELEGVAVVAVVDPDPARRRARAEQFGIPVHYENLDALFAAETIDALDIASPRDSHAGLVRQAAAHGVPVLCQKPLAPTLSEAEALAGEVRGRIRLMVHENWRFRPYYRQIAKWIGQGRLGDLTSGSISLMTSGLVPDETGRHPALVRQPSLALEGRLMIGETLIHHLDVARWLLGPLSVVGARLVYGSAAVKGESAATILLATATGAPLVVSGNMKCHGFPGYGRDRLELLGTRGSIVMVDDRLRLSADRVEEHGYGHDLAYQASFDTAIAHFVHGLRTGERFETDAEDNLIPLALVEQAYKLAALRPVHQG